MSSSSKVDQSIPESSQTVVGFINRTVGELLNEFEAYHLLVRRDFAKVVGKYCIAHVLNDDTNDWYGVALVKVLNNDATNLDNWLDEYVDPRWGVEVVHVFEGEPVDLESPFVFGKTYALGSDATEEAEAVPLNPWGQLMAHLGLYKFIRIPKE